MPLQVYNPDGTHYTWEHEMACNCEEGKATGGRVHYKHCPAVRKADHQHERMTVDEKVNQIFDHGYQARPPQQHTPEADVKSPDHYAYGGIETIDYIKAKLTPEQFTGYCWGNVLKYISRFDKKEGIKDLKKAVVYIDWLVEAYEKRLIFPHKVVE